MRAQWLLLAIALPAAFAANAAGPCVTDYGSVQEAVNRNPGCMIEVPPGDYEISEALRLTGRHGGLYGHGRIIQTNPEQPVLQIEKAEDVRVEGITLTRAEGKEDATANGVICVESRRVTLDGVRVINCRARQAAIEIRESRDCTVRDCAIINYKRIAVDDRTDNPELYGYAFFCIDGSGILVDRSTGTVLTGNRVAEENLFPTPEMKEQHQLGTLTEGKKPSVQGKLAEGAFRNRYVSNWHQGSAIVVTGPEVTRHTTVSGNVIVNAAQGIDLHCDQAVVSGNTVDHGMMGIKLTHGCRNVIVSGNMLTAIDLWGILLNPGAASHYAEPAREGAEARGENVDAGIVVANNIITDYGCGHEFWNHGGASDDLGGSYAIAIYEGQLDTNPPLRDVLFEGNIVYNTARDIPDAKPRYRYAVYIGPWGGETPGPTYPQGIRFGENIFHPGARGVSNVDLTTLAK